MVALQEGVLAPARQLPPQPVQGVGRHSRDSRDNPRALRHTSSPWSLVQAARHGRHPSHPLRARSAPAPAGPATTYDIKSNITNELLYRLLFNSYLNLEKCSIQKAGEGKDDKNSQDTVPLPLTAGRR